MTNSSHQFKICMVHSFHHNRGGDTTYTRQVTEGLQERGHVVHPFAMQHPLNDFSSEQRYFAPWTPLSKYKAWTERHPETFGPEGLTVPCSGNRMPKPDVIHVHTSTGISPPPFWLPLAFVKYPWFGHCTIMNSSVQAGKWSERVPVHLCAKGTVAPAVRHRCKWNDVSASPPAPLNTDSIVSAHRTMGRRLSAPAFSPA